MVVRPFIDYLLTHSSAAMDGFTAKSAPGLSRRSEVRRIAVEVAQLQLAQQNSRASQLHFDFGQHLRLSPLINYTCPGRSSIHQLHPRSSRNLKVYDSKISSAEHDTCS
jgi:hypothetical protein